MNQFALYLEAKERHPGMLLMFRDQDDYLIVGADVDMAAKVIDFEAIATRFDGFKVGEFESEALETNLRKLLKAGHRVAICDQIEPAALPKRVEVNRVVTPGYVPQEDTEEDSAEEKPKSLTYIGKGGNWKQVPWMFD